ncbi:MAG: O-antigen translocase [Flavobacteriales bacterium]|nr:MAG: O-antigen translocase [Flavobacteriales bacterium]|tara:strand:+ start:540 stop:1793 length:1254 start_codon:yes stop_codon:yes gene_type:complete
MNFIKTSLYSGISTAISLLVRLISNKIVAVYLGTNGIFLLGQLKDFLRLSNVLSGFGIENGIIKYTSQFQESDEELKKILSTSFKIHLIFSLIFSILILFFSNIIAEYLSLDFESKFYFLVLSISVISFSIHTLLMSIINGIKRIKLYVTINVVSVIISAIVMITLVLKYAVIGALYALIINQIITLAVTCILFYLYKPFKISLLFSGFDFNYFKKLSSFSIMAITGPTCLIISTFIVRYYISDEFDTNFAGSWEAMWRISAIYLLFLISTFKFYLIPTFSKLNNEDLKEEVFKIWKVVVPIIIIITAGVYLLRDIIITVLLSKEFFLINEIIFFHLLGDIIKINCWVLGNILISKADTKAFVFFQIEWSVIFVVLSYFLINAYGFWGVSLAYFITYIIHFSLLNIHLRKLLWIKSS